jgi:hypothetical protein
METSTETCGSCGLPASLVCGGCGQVAYCSKDHQKAHWKAGHKTNCKAYKIEKHPVYGRLLMATRELKPGSRILTKTKPVVIGPPLTSKLMTCFECNGNLPVKPVHCPMCNYPFCTEKCLHDPEQNECCQRLSKFEEDHQPKPEIMAPIKFLALQKSDPGLFERLTSLESHIDDIKVTPRWKSLQESIVQPLLFVFKDDENVTEDVIDKVIGILTTNSFELVSQTKQQSLEHLPTHGLFELASLINHDCIGNTRYTCHDHVGLKNQCNSLILMSSSRLVLDDSADEGFKLSMFASVTIPKGKPILFNYVRPLDTTLVRQTNLITFKHFQCQCDRCTDPTELGTFCSAYLCTVCQVGAIVYQGDKYTCQDCQSTIELAKAQFLDDEIDKGRIKLTKIQARTDLTLARQILRDFKEILYPTHGFLTEIKQVLVSCTAAVVNNPGPGPRQRTRYAS